MMAKQGRPINVAGIAYPSIEEASRRLDISRSRLRYWSNAGQDVSASLLEYMRTKAPYVQGGAIACVYDGKEYHSIGEVADAIGVTRKSLYAKRRRGTLHKIGVEVLEG